MNTTIPFDIEIKKVKASSPKPTFIISVDRRSKIEDELLEEVAHLSEGVQGLTWNTLLVSAQDLGKYRDFCPILEMSHENIDVLFVILNELVDVFGWKIDSKKKTAREDDL